MTPWHSSSYVTILTVTVYIKKPKSQCSCMCVNAGRFMKVRTTSRVRQTTTLPVLLLMSTRSAQPLRRHLLKYISPLSTMTSLMTSREAAVITTTMQLTRLLLLLLLSLLVVMMTLIMTMMGSWCSVNRMPMISSIIHHHHHRWLLRQVSVSWLWCHRADGQISLCRLCHDVRDKPVTSPH